MTDSIVSSSCANCAFLDSDPLTPTGVCLNPRLYVSEGFSVAEVRTIHNAPDEYCAQWRNCWDDAQVV